MMKSLGLVAMISLLAMTARTPSMPTTGVTRSMAVTAMT
jgi:hypothetical protein